MKPSQLANRLRRIASKIDRSKSPSRSLVTATIRKLIAAIDIDDAELSVALDNIMPQLEGMTVTVGIGQGDTYEATISNVEDVSETSIDCIVTLDNGMVFKFPDQVNDKGPGAAIYQTLLNLIDSMLNKAFGV